MMINFRRAVIASFTGVVLVGSSYAQTDELGAKALFYSAQNEIVSVPTLAAPLESPSTATASDVKRSKVGPSVAKAKPKAKQRPVLALRGSVLIAGSDGGTREVKPSHSFKSGDRIKVAFTSNVAGYFYLVSVGTSGRVQLVAPERGGVAIVQPGFRYQFPSSPTAYLRFEGQTGKEELWAILSDQPLDVVKLGPDRMVSIDPSKSTEQGPANDRIADAANMLASKDLVFEEDAAAAYASFRPAAAPITLQTLPRQIVTLKIVLNHQP